MFGADLFADEDMASHLADMAGLTDAPAARRFGEASELRAALHRLCRSPDWRDTPSIARVGRILAARHSDAALNEAWIAALETRSTSLLPARLFALPRAA